MVINDLTIALMVLIGIRFIACIMFTILFFQNFEVRYLILAVSWLIYMIGPVPDLTSNAAVTQTLHPFFGFSAAVGTFLLMISVVLWYRRLPLRILLTIISAVVLILGTIITVKSESIGMIAVIAQGVFLIGVLVLVIINSAFFKSSRSRVSFFWLCATLGFGLFHAFGFSILFKGAPLSARFVFTFLVNVSLLEYFIYLDWEQSFKKLMESDKRYRFLFNTAPVALFEEDSAGLREYMSGIKKSGISDIHVYFESHPDEVRTIAPKLNILEMNNKTLSLFEANSRQELIEHIDELFLDETYESLIKSFDDLLTNRGYTSFETVILTLKGNIKEVIVSCYYPEKKNLDKKTIISMLDITEKNEARKAIESSLKDKEVLLQEVHHRVKNNLAIISSILGMQHRNAEEPGMRELVNSIANRINTMAIVHDQLYTSRDLKEIDVSDYIRQLTDELQINLYSESKSVRIILEIMPVRFSINLLIPLGMLINEIVSNSIKHAFETTEDPEVKIRIYSDSVNGYVLSIEDNGSGLSKDDFYSKSDTTGFTIIDALAHQINADLTINNNEGTEFRLFLSEETVKY